MINHIRTIRIKDEHAATIIEQLSQMNALEYIDDSFSNFQLSDKQKALLDERSKTPLSDCITAEESIKRLKNKHGL
jgi:RNA binding exosome subunit